MSSLSLSGSEQKNFESDLPKNQPKDQNLQCFCNFLFLNLLQPYCIPDLSIHDKVWLGSATMKTDSQHNVKSSLELTEN